LKIIYDFQDIFIEEDKDRITQVVSNILNNAVKFIKYKNNKKQNELSLSSHRGEETAN
jgi:signal transduction histidine kinase